MPAGFQTVKVISQHKQHGPAFWQVRVFMKVVDEKHPWSDVRMGRRGGEMGLPSTGLRSMRALAACLRGEATECRPEPRTFIFRFA
jgi:hypothetical protein